MRECAEVRALCKQYCLQIHVYIYMYIYIYIYKFTRQVSTSDLPIPEAGDIRARKRF